MSNKYVQARRLRRTALAVVLSAVVGAAMAQSTSGDIVGTTTASSKVQVKSLNSGAVREATVGADGKFRVSSLPTGDYEVTTLEGGNAVNTARVRVIAGQAAIATFGGGGEAKALDTITVLGQSPNQIDLSSVETRTTFTAQQLNSLPVSRDVTSVSLLTPGTAASSNYFGPASFGGASAAENSYYINGFNVTNLYDSLSFSEVPFQAIDQLDVQTGGYGARYGFSTGGVTSVNVKRGTNEVEAGFSYTWVPNSLREQPDPVRLSNGTIFRSYDQNESSSSNLSFWAGGPIVRDKLFFYALGSFANSDSTSYGGRGSGYAVGTSPYTSNLATTASDYKSRQPYWLAKLDWYINDNNHLEYTGFDNTRKGTYNNYQAKYSSTDLDASLSKTKFTGKEYLENGGHTDILKWTSYLNDNLTMSLQYGRMKNTNSDYTTNADGVENKYLGDVTQGPSCPYVIDYRPTSSTYGQNIGCATVSTVDIYGGSNKRDAGRIDFEWQLGSHKVSFGYSDERWKSRQGTIQDIYYVSTADFLIDEDLPEEDVYERIYYATGGNVEVDQKSWYLEDNWSITDNFMLYMGLRNDSFENKNSNGVTFVKQDNIWQPRLGFTWDVLGNGNSKLYGSLGRYSLPIAANVALRAASASYYTDFYYSYNGTLDPVTKVPNGGVSYENGAWDQVNNGEDGSVPNPKAVADKGLKPYTQDELILGFQQRIVSDNAFLNDWTVGVKGTYRKVHTAIDDTCDARALYNAGKAAGNSMSNWEDEWTVPGGIPGCFLYNPGHDLTITTDLNMDGNVMTVTVPGSALGPKAKRDYKALTLSADKQSDNWYISTSYTWSKLTGNLEGLVKSTNGQDDTGTTSDFDFAEIMIGADGYLFNDHRHSFKVFGSYSFSPEWELGFNLLAQSGSPKSCLGGGTGSFGTQYGYTGVFHVCEMNPTDRAKDTVSPVGSAGRTPWVVTFSPSLVYKPHWAEGVRLNIDVMNLFNNIKPTQVYETKYSYPNSSQYRNYYNYDQAKYFSSPRYVRFQVQYDF